MATSAAEVAEVSTGGGTFTLLLFASASSYTGLESIDFPAPMPLSQLFHTLENKFPGMTNKILKSCAVCVNLEYVDTTTGNGQEETILKAGDEVGIIPPVSSG